MDNDEVHFLATKTMAPRRTRGVLARPRLTGLVDDLRQRLLTIVKAPPGYGKTTLGLAWSDELAALGAAVAWLSLDPSDNDVARLAFYMASALARAGIDVGKLRQDMLAPLCVVNPESLVALLLNAVAGQPRELFLFLDDCHLLSEPPVLGLLALLCRRAPANLHVVLIGRSDAPSALMSQVSPEDTLEIDAAALRFDVAETSQLVRKLREQPLAPDEIDRLHATTEGWPAALRAILLSPAGGKTIVPNRPISALMEDVLDHLPDRLTSFMMTIAVVDKVCADLADALAGSHDGAAMLEQICQRQLFFSARDQEQRWFSFHPLFREQLHKRLAQTRAAEIGALHRRAAAWFAAHDLWSQAVGHALAAGDEPRAIAWIEQCAMRLVQIGDLVTLLSWQSQLRAHLVEMPLRLKLAFAWALGHAMASREAAQLLDQIETATDPCADAAMRLECLALRALLKNVDDDGEAAGELAQRYLADDPGDDWIRNVMLNIVATTHLRQGHWQAFHSVPPLALADPDGTPAARFVFNRCYHLCYRGIAEYHQGRLDDAAALFEQAMHAGDAPPERFGIVAAPGPAVWVLPAALLAQVRYQQNRLADAATLVGLCLEPARIVAPLDFVSAAILTAMRLAHCQNDAGRAYRLLDDADRLARARGWTRLESMTLLERVRLCLIAGRFAEAAACLTRLDALTSLTRDSDVRKAYVARDAFLAHAWVAWANGCAAEIRHGLHRRLRVAVAAKLPLEAARLAATLALAEQQSGNREAAMAALRVACEHAEQAGAVRVLIDLPIPAEAAFEALDECRRALPPRSSLARFLAGALAPARAATPDDPASASSGDVLSGRERHVLRLVAQGQSNKEIARALGVAPNTIKFHLKGVFSKLGVGNRAQAAVQAKTLGLA